MASLPFADVDQLAAWVGEDITPSDLRAPAVLMAASALVASEIGTSVTDAWTVIPESVATVVVQAAARVWFNPQGLIGDEIDDYARRWESGQDAGIYLTSSERDILSAFRTRAKGVWTLGTTRGDEYNDQYLDVINNIDHQLQDEKMPFLPPGA